MNWRDSFNNHAPADRNAELGSPIDPLLLRPRNEAESLRGQFFTFSDDECTAYLHLFHETSQRVDLQRDIEVGEGQVPAEDEVKGLLWRRFPNVLREKGHWLLKLRFDLEFFGCAIKPLRAPLCRQILQTARLVTTLPGVGDGSIVNVGRKNEEPNGWKLGLEFQLPEKREAVGFFPARAADAPAAEDVITLRRYFPSKARQYISFKKLKDALVAVEPRDGDPAQRVENSPFFRMGLQIPLIVDES